MKFSSRGITRIRIPAISATSGCSVTRLIVIGPVPQLAGFRSARLSRLLDRLASSHPVLEAAEVAHILEAHVVQGLSRQRRASTGTAIQDDRAVLAKRRIMVGRVGIGAEF